MIWNFKDLKFVPVREKEVHSGNIEAVVTKEKAKFPQDFFPEVRLLFKKFKIRDLTFNLTINLTYKSSTKYS